MKHITWQSRFSMYVGDIPIQYYGDEIPYDVAAIYPNV